MTIEDDKNVLAAEYVLGTLDADERALAEELMALDPGFEDIMRTWERRLGELSAVVAPVEPPPAIWSRLKAQLAPESAAPAAAEVSPEAASGVAAPEEPEMAAAPPAEPVTPAAEAPVAAPSVAAGPMETRQAEIHRLTRRVRRLRFAAATATALAASLAALTVVREVAPSDALPQALRPRVERVEVLHEIVRTVEVPTPAPAEFVAVLQRDAFSPAFILTFDFNRRILTVRTMGAERHAGRSYELWLVSDKYPTPRSLGVIGHEQFTQRRALAEFDAATINTATYAVSIEPEGGSPIGVPTGPVVYTGKLVQTTPIGFPMQSP